VAAALGSGELVVTDADGRTVAARAERAGDSVQALAFDALGRLWVGSVRAADSQVRVELLDATLRSTAETMLGLYASTGADILVDGAGALAAIGTHYGPEGSLLTLVGAGTRGLEVLESWPEDRDEWADSFEIDGFGTTGDLDGCENQSCLYAVFAHAIAMVVCPDVAVGIDGGFEDGERGRSARLHGDALWVTVERDSGLRLLCLDARSLEIRGAVDLPEGAEGAQMVSEDLLITDRMVFDPAAGSNDYFVSLWEILHDR
jgi:hypothetical protein